MEHIYMRISVRKWSIDLKTIVRFMYRHVPYVATPLIVHKNAKYQVSRTETGVYLRNTYYFMRKLCFFQRKY